MDQLDRLRPEDIDLFEVLGPPVPLNTEAEARMIEVLRRHGCTFEDDEDISCL